VQSYRDVDAGRNRANERERSHPARPLLIHFLLFLAVRSQCNHFALRAEEIVMKTLITLVALAMFATALVGCKASADVDPHGSTSISLAR
jgi:hypothetical protein